MANELAVRVNTVKQLLAGQAERIRGVLPKHMTPERMLRVAQTAMSKNPKLLECEDTSIVASFVMCSELGLEPNTPLGHAHIIPYNNWNKARKQKVMEATVQIGYQGLMELVRRSGPNRFVYPEIVREKDEFRITLGLKRDLVHIPATGDRGPVIGYYAVLEMQDAPPSFTYATVEEIRAHAERYSPSFYKYQQDRGTAREIDPNGLYHKDPDAYGLKTVIKRVCKYAPKSIEDLSLARAISLDEAGGRVAIDKAGSVDVNFEPSVPVPEVEEIKPVGESSIDAFLREREQVDEVTGEVVDDCADMRERALALMTEKNIPLRKWGSMISELGAKDLDSMDAGQLEKLLIALGDVA